MYLPNGDVGVGQHNAVLWKEHMAALARIRKTPRPGHGYGSGPGGTASYDVTNDFTTGGMTVKYINTGTEAIEKGCPVFFEVDFTSSDSGNTPLKQLKLVSEPFNAVNCGPTLGIFHRVGIAASSANGSVGGDEGGTGRAYVAGLCGGFVGKDPSFGDDGGIYAHPKSTAECNGIAALHSSFSGGLSRMHTGVWEIMESVPCYDAGGAPMDVDACVLRSVHDETTPDTEQGGGQGRFFEAEILGISGGSTVYRKNYTWEDVSNPDCNWVSCDTVARNIVEWENDTDTYVSSQLKTNVGDWELQQVRKRVMMYLSYGPSGYEASFSQAAQFWGECWEQ